MAFWRLKHQSRPLHEFGRDGETKRIILGGIQFLCPPRGLCSFLKTLWYSQLTNNNQKMPSQKKARGSTHSAGIETWEILTIDFVKKLHSESLEVFEIKKQRTHCRNKMRNFSEISTVRILSFHFPFSFALFP